MPLLPGPLRVLPWMLHDKGHSQLLVSISLFYKATCSQVVPRVFQTKQIHSFETSKGKMKKQKQNPQGLEAEAREIQTENRFLSVELISLWNTFPKRGGRKALILPMPS